MSLKRHDEDGQTETSQKLPQEPKGKPKTEPKKEEWAFFSREKLHREVERLKQKNSSPHSSREVQEEYEPEEIPPPTPTLPQGIDNIRTRVHQLLDQSGANTQNAKVDERVLLMASAVLEMCDLLKNYSESMNSEMARLNENALQNLSLQEQYAKSVKTEVADSVYGIYHQVKEQEKEAVNELMQYVEANSNQMEKDITACTENVKSATAAAEKASKKIAKSLERFRRVKTFRDLLYYASPILVAVDIILRVIALAAHTP